MAPAAGFDKSAIDALAAYAGVDAVGVARDAAFLDPFGPGLADIGALEAVRQALPGSVGILPAGAPVPGDLSGGAADLTGTAADFNGAALTGMGDDDRLGMIGATSAAQFAHDGMFLTYDEDGDGTAEAATWLSPAPGDAALDLSFETRPGGAAIFAAALAPLGAAIGEVMRISIATDWQTLSFANVHVDAVVFALAPTLNEIASAATRLRNISETGAEIRLQETKLKIDPATGLQEVNASGRVDEMVTLVVLEKGVHALENGTAIQVGEINTGRLFAEGFETIAFEQEFAARPSIFSQVQTFYGTDFIISRRRTPTTAGFEPAMQEEQADNIDHATETVGWLALEHGGGALSGMDFQVGSSAANVNGRLMKMSFNSAFDTAPLVMAALASYTAPTPPPRASRRSGRTDSPPWRLRTRVSILRRTTALRSSIGWHPPPKARSMRPLKSRCRRLSR